MKNKENKTQTIPIFLFVEKVTNEIKDDWEFPTSAEYHLEEFLTGCL